MFGPEDDLILKILSQIVEVVAVSCHPDYQIPVQFGMLLCIAKCFGIYHIELNVMAVETEIASDQ